MSNESRDEYMERLKAAVGKALGDGTGKDRPVLTGEVIKAVMRRATELTRTGLPVDRAIRQAKQELGG